MFPGVLEHRCGWPSLTGSSNSVRDSAAVARRSHACEACDKPPPDLTVDPGAWYRSARAGCQAEMHDYRSTPAHWHSHQIFPRPRVVGGFACDMSALAGAMRSDAPSLRTLCGRAPPCAGTDRVGSRAADNHGHARLLGRRLRWDDWRNCLTNDHTVHHQWFHAHGWRCATRHCVMCCW